MTVEAITNNMVHKSNNEQTNIKFATATTTVIIMLLVVALLLSFL